MLSPGAAIGRYLIHRKLAEGGMAEVYLASATGPEGFAKDVVIKVVRSFLSNDQQFIDMFVAEARLSSRLNHANVVQIFDFGKTDESYYLAMEYVRGASLWDLRKRCRERGVPFPPTLAAEIGSQVARGLQYAHGLTDRGQPLGIVHRDVTPHNVLLSFDGAIKLTDFGIAKAGTTQTAPGILKGKFAYMSPEQARGESVDSRSDVFAMGIVLWELLTGGRLFDADSELGVLRAVQSSAITPPVRLNPDVPEELSEIVLKALARPLEERFQTAAELERALATFVLRHAKTVEESSSSAFLQQMFREEYEAVNRAHDSPGPGDELASKGTHGDTVESPVRRAAADAPTQTPRPLGEIEAPAPIDLAASVQSTAQMPGVKPSQSQRLKPLPPATERPGDRPKTDVMPAERVSRGLPTADGAAHSNEARGWHGTQQGPSDTADEDEAPAQPVKRSQTLPVINDGAERPSSAAAVTLDEDSTGAGSLPQRTLSHDDVAAELPRRSLWLLMSVVLAGVALAAGTAAWWVSSTPSVAAVTVKRERPASAPLVKPTVEVLVLDAGEEAPVLAEGPPVAAADAPVEPAAAPRAAKPVDAGAARVIAPAPVVTSAVELKAVPYATLTIDGRLLGEVEGVRTIRLAVGSHELVFTHPRVTRKERVIVKAGQTASVSFDARVQ